MREQILAYMRRWIGILRLGDEWEITLKLDPALKDLGRTEADPAYGRARVELLDPARAAHPDWKRTLIHELLHVRIPLAAPPGTALCGVIEHSVEMLARILYQMDSTGVAPDVMFRKAHAWARTITTARVGARMSRMGNGKRAMEIIALLAAMKLPEEAMTLVTELGGFAVDDGGGTGTATDPMLVSDPAKGGDPMLTADPGKNAAAMARAILGPDGFKSYQANLILGASMAAENARAGVIAMARRELGDGADALKPEQEGELLKMTPSEAAAALRFAKSRKAAPTSMARADDIRPPNPDTGAPLLAPGEDAAKMHPAILEARASQARQFGRDTVQAALNAKAVS